MRGGLLGQPAGLAQQPLQHQGQILLILQSIGEMITGEGADAIADVEALGADERSEDQLLVVVQA